MAIAVLVVAFTVLTGPAPRAEAAGELTGSFPTSDGVATAVWSGGSLSELINAAWRSGCDAVSVWVVQNGKFISNVVGAPAFVNAAWSATYPGDIPAGTIVLLTCTVEAVTVRLEPTALTLRFIVGSSDSWTWYRPATTTDALEYGWYAELSTLELAYQFGFWLFKFAGATETTGSFAQLLGSGQTSVFRGNAGSYSLASQYDGAISVVREGSALLITFTEPGLLAQLLNARPRTALAVVTSAGSPTSTSTVQVQY